MIYFHNGRKMKKKIIIITILTLCTQQIDAAKPVKTITITNRSSGITVNIPEAGVTIAPGGNQTFANNPNTTYTITASTSNKRGPNYSGTAQRKFNQGNYEIKAETNSASSDPKKMLTITVSRPKKSASRRADSGYNYGSYNYEDDND